MLNAIVEQLVSLSPCHGEGCEFESRLLRQRNVVKMQMYNNWLVYLPVKEKVVGSNPIICAFIVVTHFFVVINISKLDFF